MIVFFLKFLFFLLVHLYVCVFFKTFVCVMFVDSFVL
jgi:hypothetical protein